MQPPVGQPGDHGLRRQLGAVQEEQQGDGQVGEDIRRHGRVAAHGQHAGQHDQADEDQSEIVGYKARPLHGWASGCLGNATL